MVGRMQPKVIGVITLDEERQLHMKNEHDGSLTTGVQVIYPIFITYVIISTG